MRRLLIAVMVATLGVLGVGSAEALVLNLNCVLTASGCTSSAYNYGTITILDNAGDANKVDITVDVNGGTKFKSLMLNFDADLNSSGWSLAVHTVSADENAKNLPPYPGLFDLEFGPNGGVDEPFTYVLAKTGHDLDPADFNFLDTGGLLHAAVHIQACTGEAGSNCVAGLSVKVGAGPSAEDTGGTAEDTGGTAEDTGGTAEDTGGTAEDTGGQVPGPATALLVSLGLIGFAVRRRR